MTDTQWLLEGESLFLEEKKKQDELQVVIDVVKKTVATYLGVNIMPVQDEETGMLRMPEDHEIIPLSVLCGRPEMLEGIVNKHKEMSVQESIEGASEAGEFEEMSPDELDDVMSDIDFVNDPEEMEKALGWRSEATQYVQDNVVEIIENTKEEKDVKVEKSESDSIKIVTDEVSFDKKPRDYKVRIESD